ncbi:MAG: DUF2304 domain-containing protein [Pseudohongiellaceae bacterium]
MERYQLTSAFIGLVIATSILWLVRRDHLHGRFAIWWISVGLGCALLGIFPQMIDSVALRLGVSYPPTLALVIGLSILVLKIIIMDIERSKNEIKLQRLVQRMAILENEIESGKQQQTEN